MATYTFETMTQVQADAFASGDVLLFSTATASARSVGVVATAATPVAVSKLSFTLAGKNLVFNQSGFADETSIIMTDGSKLIVATTVKDSGSAGDDQIYGGLGLLTDGNDTLSGGNGSDFLHGNNGADSLVGGNGDDTVYGGKSADTIYGDNGNDFLHGNMEADSVWGGNGNDTLYGGQGADTLNGGGDNDVLFGDSNDDQLLGENGNDTIYGGQGADSIMGGLYTQREEPLP